MSFELCDPQSPRFRAERPRFRAATCRLARRPDQSDPVRLPELPDAQTCATDRDSWSRGAVLDLQGRPHAAGAADSSFTKLLHEETPEVVLPREDSNCMVDVPEVVTSGAYPAARPGSAYRCHRDVPAAPKRQRPQLTPIDTRKSLTMPAGLLSPNGDDSESDCEYENSRAAFRSDRDNREISVPNAEHEFEAPSSPVKGRSRRFYDSMMKRSEAGVVQRKSGHARTSTTAF